MTDTVVSIRCHGCGEVKRKKDIEMGANGNICSDCKGRDVPEANSDDGQVSEQSVAQGSQNSSEDSDTPNESAENDENAEEDKKPLRESFNEQDPLEW